MDVLDGVDRYAHAAFRLLQFVEGRRPTGRRFGADADARWSSFKGDLATADRLELLIRDADAEWPGAFGARTVYALRAVAEDDPFGARWPGLDPIAVEDLWRRMRDTRPPATPADACKAIAAAWDLDLRPFTVATPRAEERLVVAGPSAIAATIAAFATATAVDWADQVVTVATPPAHRQLAAAATALVHATRAATILTAADVHAPLATARALVSDDATAADRARALELAGARG